MAPHAPTEILAVGMVTPVGLGTAQTAASVRAGIGRLRESDLTDRWGNALVMGLADETQLPALVDDLEDRALSVRQTRMTQMGGAAIAEALADHDGPPPVLHLGIADPRPEAHPLGDEMLALLAMQSGRPFDTARSRVHPVGRASGLVALNEALGLIDRREAETVLVGAIDSYWDMGLLEALDGEGRLKTGEIADGFVPGEGAAFILLRASRAAKRPAQPRVRIVATGLGNEPGHLYSQAPYHGEGLAEAVRAAFAAAPPEIGQRRVGCVYAGLNGESHWAKEWGVSHIRNAHRFEERVRIEHPADCMGDPGAALGLILLGLAAHRQDPDPEGAPSLVWCSSDREPRAAVLIAR